MKGKNKVIFFIVILCLVLSLRPAEAMAESGTGGDSIRIDKYSFPDDTFRDYIEKYDTNHNGVLSEKERNKVRNLELGGKKIYSLEGIEYFENLRKLECGKCRLTSLDLDGNTELTDVTASGNSYSVKLPVVFCKDLPGNFEGKKVSGVKGGSYDRYSNTFRFEGGKVITYRYKISDNRKETFKIKTSYDVDNPPVNEVRIKTLTGLKAETDYGLMKISCHRNPQQMIHYKFAYRPENSGKWTYIMSDVNHIMLKDLEKDRPYEIKAAHVLGVPGTGLEKRSKYKYITAYTNTDGNTEQPMKKAEVKSVKPVSGKTTVTAEKRTYKSSAGETQYKFAYRLKGSDKWKYSKWREKTSVDFKKLKKKSTYSFKTCYRYKSSVDNETYVRSRYSSSESGVTK